MSDRPVDYGVDPDIDPHRGNPEVHYRLYDSDSYGLTVVCVQDLDYPAYDHRRFVSPEAFGSERAAWTALDHLVERVRLVAERSRRSPPTDEREDDDVPDEAYRLPRDLGSPDWNTLPVSSDAPAVNALVSALRHLPGASLRLELCAEVTLPAPSDPGGDRDAASARVDAVLAAADRHRVAARPPRRGEAGRYRLFGAPADVGAALGELYDFPAPSPEPDPDPTESFGASLHAALETSPVDRPDAGVPRAPAPPFRLDLEFYRTEREVSEYLRDLLALEPAMLAWPVPVPPSEDGDDPPLAYRVAGTLGQLRVAVERQVGGDHRDVLAALVHAEPLDPDDVPPWVGTASCARALAGALARARDAAPERNDALTNLAGDVPTVALVGDSGNRDVRAVSAVRLRAASRAFPGAAPVDEVVALVLGPFLGQEARLLIDDAGEDLLASGEGSR